MFVNVKAYSVKWIACIIGEGGVQREISLFILNGIHFTLTSRLTGGIFHFTQVVNCG